MNQKTDIMMKLKYYLRLISFILFVFILSSAYSQTDKSCKVLIAKISGVYNGDCKNGLAHGKGIAKGVDTYVGRFKKGMPNGQGKYTWENGDYYDGNWKKGKRNGKGIMYQNTDGKKVLGLWKDDVFIKEIVEPPYKIIRSLNVMSVIITENPRGVKGNVDIYFNRDGRITRSVNSLSLESSSGAISQSMNYCGFENVIFPIEGKISFTTSNRLNVGTIQCDVEFKITKESSWKIVIRY